MPAPLFKRFAPPTSIPAPVQAHAADKAVSPEAAPPKKEKKSKKRKSEVAEPVAAPVESYEHSEDVVMEDAPAATPKSSKKSKKRKSEVIEAQDEQDGEVSRKHKAVFSKFEKASKLAEARKDQDEAEDEVQQPEEELHGEPNG